MRLVGRITHQLHSLRIGRLRAVGMIGGLLLFAALAWSYFTLTGTGKAAGNVGTLTAPAITSATPGSGTVGLSWSTVTAPSGSTPVAYYVTRDGGAPAGTCPASAATATTSTTCTDGGVSAGSHTYHVVAVWASWTATSAGSTVTVSSQQVAKLVFTTQPDGSATGGVAFPQQPVVTAEDANGNTVTGYTGVVALSIKSGTGSSGATLSGCAGTLSNGVTTFSGCKIDKVGTGYVLTASDGTFSVDSSAFNVSAGPATRLVFTTQPDGSATGGVAFPQQPVVTAQDAGGNTATGYSGTVSLSIKSGTGTSGANLSGCAGTLSNGVTSFSGCKVDKAGSGYVLTASDGSFNVDSSSFNVSVGAAAKLVYTTQPDGSPTGGVAFPQQPAVTAEDAGGNTVTSYTGIVALSIKSGTGTSGATLSGCIETISNGVSSFSGCKIDKAGTSYVLTASDGTFSVDSNSFNVSVGPAAKLVFSTQPDGSATGGVAFPQQPVVTAQDAGGNTATGYSGTVSLSIKSGTGTSGAILSGCAGTLSNGVTTFSGCKINLAGTGYVLSASDGTFNADSNSFNVSAGPAAKLVFTTQPDGSATPGAAFPQQPVVTAQDAGGNTAAGYTGVVTLSIKSGTGTSGATLTGCTRTLSNSVTTFSGCKINLAGTGYVLTASDGTLSVDSASFNVVGPAAKLAFTQQPGGAAAGAVFLSQPVVAVEDSAGNIVTSDTSAVSLTLNPAPGANNPKLQGCTSSNSNGVTTFSGCSINQAGNGYSLTATDGSLTSTTSNSFNVSGSASQLVFTTQPDGSATGGLPFPTQPVVTVEDSSGNVVYNDNHGASLSITSGTGTSGATLSGCVSNESAGVITFSGCAINKAGNGYTLTATDGGQVTPAISNAFNVSVGPAAQLGLSAQTSSPTSGAGDNLTITAQDAGGNTVTSYTGSHNLTFAGANNAPNGASPTVTDSSGTALSFGSPTPINFSAGVATVSGSTNGVMTLYDAQTTSISVTDGTINNGTGLPVTVNPAAATKLSFTQQPDGSATGGVAFPQQPIVTLQDQYANTATNNNSSVTLAIASGPAGTLTCTNNPQTASSGVANFSGCKIDKAGTYTLRATDGSLTSATSASFTVSVGPAAKLAFTTQPDGSATGGIAFPQQPVVAVQDAGGNTVPTDTSNVTLAIASGPSGATLSCTSNPLAASSGVASFSGCKLDKAGTYTLRATDGSLTSATSASFTVSVGPAAKLAFTTQPDGSATGGTAFPQQPVVTVQDAGGNTVTTDSSNVTLAIASGPSGATLTCTSNPQAASGGVATFSGCKIDKAGTYTLSATDGTLTSATSASFTVSVGAAAKLAFTTQPDGSATGGLAFPQQPIVAVQDAGGNTVTGNSSSVTLAIASGPTGATLTCTTNPLAASSGVATFSGCKLDKAGTYTLKATDGALTSATSASFTVSVGPASQLVLSAATTTPTAGAADNLTITAQDAGGNTATSYTGSHNLTFSGANNAPSGATPTVTDTSGTAVSFGSPTAINFSNGVATVSGSSNGVMTLYDAQTTSITVTDGTVNNGSGPSVTVSPAGANQLGFTQQPDGSATGGVAFPQQPKVAVQDQFGNTVTSNTSSVTLAIASGPAGTLTCTTNPLAAASGVASFSGCKIDVAGTYTLLATDGTLASGTSASFTVAVGPAAKLGFTTQPDGSATGGVAFPQQPVVAVQDAGGNTVTTNTSNVTLAIATGPTGATLTCNTNPLAASSGVATFAGCKLDKAGTYTLTTTDGSLASATSASFTVSVGPAAKLAFTTQPDGSAQSGFAFPQQPVVAVQDAGGNTVTTDSSNVTLSIASGPSGASLTCTNNPQAASIGVATFSGCKLDKAGTYTLTVSDGSLTSATSASFTVTQAVTATKVTSQVNIGTSETTATPSFASTNGVTYLILIMHQDTTTTGNINATVSSGALTGITQIGSNNKFLGGQYLYAFRATGNGSSAAVSAVFNGGNNQETTIEVIQLSGNSTSTPIAQWNTTGAGNSATAAATLTSPSGLNGEVVLVGANGSATITAPTGFTQLDTQSGSAGGGFTNGSYIDSSAQSSSSFGLGSSQPWGTIAIEINHA